MRTIINIFFVPGTFFLPSWPPDRGLTITGMAISCYEVRTLMIRKTKKPDASLTPLPALDYQIVVRTECFRHLTLKIHQLESLNATIDQVFDHLQASHREELLSLLCPYFGVVWASARALVEWISEHHREISGQILEVGCGLALPTITLAHYGKSVTCSDHHPDIERFLTLNLRENLSDEQRARVTYRAFDWTLRLDAPSPLDGPYDWIFGSDILYESIHPQTLSEAFDRLLAPGGKIVLADPARPYLQTFMNAMRDRGFTEKTQIVTTTQEIFFIIFYRNPA